MITRISTVKTHGLCSITRVSASFTHAAGLEKMANFAVDVDVGADLPWVIAGVMRVIAVGLRAGGCDCCRTQARGPLCGAPFSALRAVGPYSHRSTTDAPCGPEQAVVRRMCHTLPGGLHADYERRVVVHHGCEIAVKALIERAKTRSRSPMTHRRAAFVAVK